MDGENGTADVPRSGDLNGRPVRWFMRSLPNVIVAGNGVSDVWCAMTTLLACPRR